MLEKIQSKTIFSTTCPNDFISKPSIGTLQQSSLESMNKSSYCCLDYCKNLFYTFLEVLQSFIDLFKVLFCCDEDEKLPFHPIVEPELLSDEDRHFKALPLDIENDLPNIDYVFRTMAHPRRFVFEGFKLLKTKEMIKHIHPFRLIQCLFTTKLKEDVRKFRSTWVWDIFIKEFTESFERFKEDPILCSHGLAHALKFKTNTELLPFIQEKQWQDLFDFLLRNV